MEIWIVLFLVVIQTSAGFAASVLSQGARKVKNGAAYGGANAVGDGVTDDTQALLDAFNLNRGIGPRSGALTGSVSVSRIRLLFRLLRACRGN